MSELPRKFDPAFIQAGTVMIRLVTDAMFYERVAARPRFRNTGVSHLALCAALVFPQRGAP